MKFLKLLVPNKLRKIIKESLIYRYRAYINYKPDMERFILYSNSCYPYNSESKIKGRLSINYHIIEKGLTMPDCRLGFGEKVILELIILLKSYIKKGYDKNSLEFKHSIMVLNEYLHFHKQNQFEVKEDIVNEITSLSENVKIYDKTEQKEFMKNEFFLHSNSSFENFCLSRHSVRNFINKEIDTDILLKCVDLAQKSPSLCNRQPNRAYIVKNEKKIKEVLEVQNGNRGFGHLSKALFVVTSDLSVIGNFNERNEPFFNAGMFCMSLINALHFYKIGSCSLNWSATKENDKKLRILLNIPNNEVITLIIACGYVPEKFQVADSPRLKSLSVTKLID